MPPPPLAWSNEWQAHRPSLHFRHAPQVRASTAKFAQAIQPHAPALKFLTLAGWRTKVRSGWETFCSWHNLAATHRTGMAKAFRFKMNYGLILFVMPERWVNYVQPH
jgi:hypothetical protein